MPIHGKPTAFTTIEGIHNHVENYTLPETAAAYTCRLILKRPEDYVAVVIDNEHGVKNALVYVMATTDIDHIEVYEISTKSEDGIWSEWKRYARN